MEVIKCLDFFDFFLSIYSETNIQKRNEVQARPAITSSKLTIETIEQGDRSGIFIVNFEHISHLVLVFLLLPENM